MAAAVAQSRTRFFVPLAVGGFAFALCLVLGLRHPGESGVVSQIAAGRWIMARHMADMTGSNWLSWLHSPGATHEWLLEVVVAAVFDRAGWAGIAGFTALAAGATIAVLARALLRHLAPVPAAIAALLADGLLAPVFRAPPAAMAALLVLVWAAALVAARERGAAPSFCLVGLMAMWANLDASFVIGLAVAALFAAEAMMGGGLRATSRWGMFLVLAFSAAAVSPRPNVEFAAPDLIVHARVSSSRLLVMSVNPGRFLRLVRSETDFLAPLARNDCATA